MIKKKFKNFFPFFSLFLFAFFFFSFSFLSFRVHEGLKTLIFDLTNMDQAAWSITRGELLLNSSTGVLRSRFGIHFEPLFFLIAPFYYLWMSPKTLFLIQSLLICLGGIAFYLLAKEKLESRFFGLIFQFAYYLNPFLQKAAIANFHTESLNLGLLPLSFYFLEKKRSPLFLFFILLAISTKENVSLVILFFGIYLLLIKKQRKLGLTLFSLGFLWFILAMKIIIPYFSVSGEDPYFSEKEVGFYYYRWLGKSLNEAVLNIFKNPWLVLGRFLRPEILAYLIFLLAPLGFFSLFSPISLVGFPIFFINVLGPKLMSYLITDYNSSLLPFLFMGAILGVRFLSKFGSRLDLKLIGKEVLISIFFFFSFIFNFFSFVPWRFFISQEDFSVPENARFLGSFKGIIKPTATLSTQNNLGPHFSHREKIYLFPNYLLESDFVLINLYDAFQAGLQEEDNKMAAFYYSPKEIKENVERVFADEDFGVVWYGERYLLFKKGTSKIKNEEAFLWFQENWQILEKEIEENTSPEAKRRYIR